MSGDKGRVTNGLRFCCSDLSCKTATKAALAADRRNSNAEEGGRNLGEGPTAAGGLRPFIQR